MGGGYRYAAMGLGGGRNTYSEIALGSNTGRGERGRPREQPYLVSVEKGQKVISHKTKKTKQKQRGTPKNITVCPRSSYPVYSSKLLFKMGYYFLDTLYMYPQTLKAEN